MILKNRPVLYFFFIGFILYLLYLQEGLNLKEEGSILLLASALGLAVNYIRSYHPKLHKLAVVAGSFFLVFYALLVLSNTSPLAPLLFLFPLTLSILGHGIYGGVVLYVLAGAALSYHHHTLGLSKEVYLETMILLGCALVSLLYFSRIHHQVVKNNEDWLQKLHTKINEMTLLRDITTSMQSVKDLKKLDKIVLTALTAGYGLGFNRGLLFLVEEDTLVGEYAIGPSNRKEAYRIWGDVVIKQSNLHEVLNSPEEKDETLLDVIRKVSLPLARHERNPLLRCVREKTPLLIRQGNPEDLGPVLEKLSFENYAVVPMISKDQVVGVYLVDNCFNQKPILDEDLDALITFSGQAALAFENIQLYDKIRTLAITDELTKVYNHRHYKDTIARYMESGISFILMVIDVDDFKSFNEIYGHATGDEVLKEVGGSLKNAVKFKGEAFRYGGDEFTIILPKRTREEALDVARTIQDSALSIALHKVDHPLTLSIGLAAYPEDASCEKELFILADRKLKSAKESGKNTIHWEVL